MRILNIIEKVVVVPTVYNYELVANYNVDSIGDGKWSIEAVGRNGNIIKVWIGSNGTRRPADDLWAQVEAWSGKIAKPKYKAKIVVAPDGYRGSYKALEREVLRGRLHGCLISF